MIIKLLLRNTFRHKLRAFLTILGITITLLAFGLLRTVITTWYAMVETASASRLVTRNSISLTFPLPLAYKDKLRQVEGVKTVSYGSWFGGIYIDEKHFFANYAVEPISFLDIYPEYILSPDQKAALFRDRKACIAGRKLIAKYGWKIGDIITLKGTIFPGNWEFVLRGIYQGRDKYTEESSLIFHWDYLNEIMRKTTPGRADQVGFYMIGLTKPDLAAEVSLAIDKTFKNSLAETLTETERAFHLSFLSMSEALLTAIQIVSLVIIIIIMAVVANTMSMTARERMGEYAVFKTLGFGGWHIARLIFGESLVITMLGCAMGIALTFPAAKAFGNAMETYFPVFIVAPETLYLDIAASIFVGLVAAIIPTLRAIKISIADGLRRVG